MKNLGTKLFITGIFVIVLSGLEKILIYLATPDFHDNLTLKSMTPSIIWNVTRNTFVFGIVILIIGVLLLVYKNGGFLQKQIETIKTKNKEFEDKHF
ncbi:hypothetical protein PALU110988_04170 [Paenibacillus lupini]|uniref:hypothetical protein n=1 Tax=Paenibacillus lupini TaxID=1450204 RepID=UPI00142057E3|nr:hypothetical protein [Paenibacillus lupini]NIK25509.1 putative membrane protein [Paenibacillus lupini]